MCALLALFDSLEYELHFVHAERPGILLIASHLASHNDLVELHDATINKCCFRNRPGCRRRPNGPDRCLQRLRPSPDDLFEGDGVSAYASIGNPEIDGIEEVLPEICGRCRLVGTWAHANHAAQSGVLFFQCQEDSLPSCRPVPLPGSREIDGLRRWRQAQRSD